jgi:NTE family protein
VFIVQINPIKRPGVPKSAREILNRMNEITFNASLLRELRSVDFVTRLMDEGHLKGTGYRRVLVHMIGDEAALSGLGASSKLNTEAAFLEMLFQKGRRATDNWLVQHFGDVGERSTVNIRELFMGDEDALDGSRIKRNAHFRDQSPTEASEAQ